MKTPHVAFCFILCDRLNFLYMWPTLCCAAGDNIFSAAPDHLWVDDLGLHHTYAPVNNGPYVATEVWIDKCVDCGNRRLTAVRCCT
jgi:hypothetical protein